MGLGYTVGLVVLSTIRQIVSTGILNFTNPFNSNIVIFETTFFPAEYAISMFKDPIGAFFSFALLAAALTAYKNSENKKSWHIGAGVVALVLVGFIALRSDFMIDNTPVVETPVVETTPVKVNMENEYVSTFTSEVTNTVDNGDGSVTYSVKCDGYAVQNYEGGQPNELDVTIKDGAVVSVVVTKAADTAYVGDVIKSNINFFIYISSDFSECKCDGLDFNNPSTTTIGLLFVIFVFFRKLSTALSSFTLIIT